MTNHNVKLPIAAGLIIGTLSCLALRPNLRRSSALILGGVVLTGLGYLASAMVEPSMLPMWFEPLAIFHLSLAAGQTLIFAGAIRLICYSAPREESLLTKAEAPLSQMWLECGTCARQGLRNRRCAGCGFHVCASCRATGRCIVCSLEQEAALGSERLLPSRDHADAPRFVVLGGGLVGSLVGLFLGKRGFEVDIYERAEGAATWEGIINLNQPAVRLLELAAPR